METAERAEFSNSAIKSVAAMEMTKKMEMEKGLSPAAAAATVVDEEATYVS